MVPKASACLVLFAAALVSAACNKNNCLRAVIASAFPTRPVASDCSKFMTQTFTPPVVTVVSTSTDIVTIPVTLTTTVGAPPLRKRAGTIPAYASACDNSAAYSSACSCQGFTETTITLPPVTTTLSTTTSTSVTTTATDVVCQPTAAGSQIVGNPSFEDGSAWSFPSQCFYRGASGAKEGSRHVFCSDNTAATVVISQSLTLCAGVAYDFSAYIGFDNGGVPSAPRNAEYEVLFNDIVIVSRRAQCSGGCPILPTNGNVYAGFDFDTGTLPAQAQITTGLLKINVYHPGYTGGQFQNFIVDVVNLKVAA